MKTIQQTSMEQRVDLSLTGMHCASCATLIERSLRKTPGVKWANVNYATEKATVVYEGEKTNISTLKHNTLHSDALNALLALGINRLAADQAIQKTLVGQQNLPLEDLIKKALRTL